jgi:hypothetical protein
LLLRVVGVVEVHTTVEVLVLVVTAHLLELQAVEPLLKPL